LKIFAEGTAPSRTATYRGFAIRGAVFAACLTLFAILAAFISPQRIAAQQQAASASPSAPTQDYLVYVVCESADKVVQRPARNRGLAGQRVCARIPRPRTAEWFCLETETDDVIRYTPLGLFPATMDISRDGEFIWVANANFHGDMVPSSISVVATGEMVEVKRITTCTMPHGSRLNPQGTKQYSACMMDDMLAEIDTHKFDVSRHFLLTKDKEMGMSGAPHGQMKMGELTCVPTWAQPSNDGEEIYVACNKSNEIAVVDVASWKLSRRFPAGNGVYNLAMTKDGRLIATNKRGQSVSVFDPKTGKELAKLPTKRKVVHGAVVTPDNRYAFISVEGVGTDPGTVEVIDLQSLKTVTTIDVPEQAAGIDFWKTENK
jgi:DNA-binding beta-propeller fold protein YncE